jgi:hypothetical protein
MTLSGDGLRSPAQIVAWKREKKPPDALKSKHEAADQILGEWD